MSSISGIPDPLSWYKCSNILNLYTKMCKIKFWTVKCLDQKKKNSNNYKKIQFFQSYSEFNFAHFGIYK